MSDYRALLLNISNHLTSEDVTGLKYLCVEVIPAGRAEKITRAFEFFSELERLNLLSEENRDFLASKLIAINRNDLRNKLLGIQGKGIYFLAFVDCIVKSQNVRCNQSVDMTKPILRTVVKM